MGRFASVEPIGPLAAVADALWCYTPGPAERGPTGLRVLPDGRIDLIARLRLGPRGVEPEAVTVCGPTDRFKRFELSPGYAWVGVRFRLGAVGPAAGVDPAGLFGRSVDARECSARYGGLWDAIAGRPDPRAALAALGDDLAGRDWGARPAEWLARGLRLLAGGGRVAEVARAVGVSERTLRRGVVAVTGLSPKSVARIARFRAAVDRLRHDPANLCAVALSAGYADQAHLCREVAEFAGLTPSAIRSGEPEQIV